MRLNTYLVVMEGEELKYSGFLYNAAPSKFPNIVTKYIDNNEVQTNDIM